MPKTKTAGLNIKLTPGTRDQLAAAAAEDHRSMANFIEKLLRDYLAERGKKKRP